MRYRLMLIGATLIWGSSFVMMKDMTALFTPSWLLTIRFGVSALLMAVITWPKRKLWFDRGYLRATAVISIFYAMAWYTQTMGLVYTTPGKNAFLTATYCVIVPFVLWLIFKNKPRGLSFLAAGVCLTGIGCISLDSGLVINVGDLLTLVGAVFYALQIVFYDRYVQDRDPLVLTGMQFVGVAGINLVLALLTEPFPNFAPLGLADWATLGYLIVFCTVIALILQGVGQKHLPAPTCALLLSLESVFGAAFSVAVGAEVLSARVLVGFVLVFAAVVISEAGPSFLRKRS